MEHLVAEDSAGAQVVAVAESAGDAEDLELLEERGLFQQPVDVQGFGLRAGLLEGEGGFGVAVGAGGAEDQDVGRGHRRDLGLEISGFGGEPLAVSHRKAVPTALPSQRFLPCFFQRSQIGLNKRRFAANLQLAGVDNLANLRMGNAGQGLSKAAALAGRTSQRKRVFDSLSNAAAGRLETSTSSSTATSPSIACSDSLKARPPVAAWGTLASEILAPSRRQRPFRRRPPPSRPRKGRDMHEPVPHKSPCARRRTSFRHLGIDLGHFAAGKAFDHRKM